LECIVNSIQFCHCAVNAGVIQTTRIRTKNVVEGNGWDPSLNRKLGIWCQTPLRDKKLGNCGQAHRSIIGWRRQCIEQLAESEASQNPTHNGQREILQAAWGLHLHFSAIRGVYFLNELIARARRECGFEIVAKELRTGTQVKKNAGRACRHPFGMTGWQ
jgi:hypothetical protein